jgi:hypothetical protein
MRRFVEGTDNPVRAIDVFVDELDLAELGFGGVDPEATGRPSYHPSAPQYVLTETGIGYRLRAPEHELQ